MELESVYRSLQQAPHSGIAGPQALFEKAQELGLGHVSLEDCQLFLQSKDEYTIHRPSRRNYPRNRIVANSPGEIVQVDIMDMQRVAEGNDDYRYALVAYDSFSKFLWTRPLANRKPESVLAALQELKAELPFAIGSIFWDKVGSLYQWCLLYSCYFQEGAFISKKVQSWLREQSIHNYTTTSKVKAPGVERAIRTLRRRLAIHWEAKKSASKRWLEALPAFVDAYNNRIHSSTRLRPLDLIVDPLLIPKEALPESKGNKVQLPPVGALVRLNKARGVFEKEAVGSWTTEVFRIARHNLFRPIPMAYLEDLQGEPIRGGFYPEELQEVHWNGQRDVDQVLAERKRKGRPQYYVSYKGWPPKFNEWVDSLPKF